MRRKLLAVLAVAAALLTIAPGNARAQNYPDRPVKMLIASRPPAPSTFWAG